MSDHVLWDASLNTEPVTVPPNEQMWFRCDHCGAKHMLVLPCSIQMAATVAKAFGADHRRCKPRRKR